MVSNTVQTLIDEVKDSSGQSNISDAKVIRALNRGVDSLSTVLTLASGRNGNDSRNHGDVARVTTTVTSVDTKVSLEDELVTLKQIDVLVDGVYRRVEPVDCRDNDRQPLDTTYATPGRPLFYDREGNHAYLYPRPDASYTLRLTYGRLHPRYTATNLTESTGLMPLHEDYVVMFATDRVLIGTNDPNITSVRNALVQLRQDVINVIKNQDEDTPHRIKPKLNNAFASRNLQ